MAKIENVEDFGKHFAPDLIRCDLIKSLVAIQMLTNPFKEKVHIIMIGSIASAKTDLLLEVSKCHPKAIYVSKKTTQAGLQGVATRHGVEGGVFEGVDGGVLCVDELDKIEKQVREMLLEPLQTGIATTTAYGYKQTIKARINLLAAANPKGYTWRGGVSAAFIPFHPALMSRIHFVVPIQSLNWDDYEKVLAESYISREKRTDDEEGKRLAMLETFIEGRFEEIPTVSMPDNLIRRVTKNTGQLLKAYNNPKTPVTPRTIEGIRDGSKGKARLEGRSEVNDDDVDYLLSTIDKLFKWWHLSL